MSMLDPEALRQELRRRLEGLENPAHARSECFASTRRILLEGLAWSVGAALLWITTVFVR